MFASFDCTLLQYRTQHKLRIGESDQVQSGHNNRTHLPFCACFNGHHRCQVTIYKMWQSLLRSRLFYLKCLALESYLQEGLKTHIKTHWRRIREWKEGGAL